MYGNHFKEKIRKFKVIKGGSKFPKPKTSRSQQLKDTSNGHL